MSDISKEELRKQITGKFANSARTPARACLGPGPPRPHPGGRSGPRIRRRVSPSPRELGPSAAAHSARVRRQPFPRGPPRSLRGRPAPAAGSAAVAELPRRREINGGGRRGRVPLSRRGLIAQRRSRLSSLLASAPASLPRVTRARRSRQFGSCFSLRSRAPLPPHCDPLAPAPALLAASFFRPPGPNSCRCATVSKRFHSGGASDFFRSNGSVVVSSRN